MSYVGIQTEDMAVVVDMTVVDIPMMVAVGVMVDLLVEVLMEVTLVGKVLVEEVLVRVEELTQ